VIRRAAIVAAVLLAVFALTAPVANARVSSSGTSWYSFSWFWSAINFNPSPSPAPFTVCGALTAHPYCGWH
jgi:hypothetical protein